MADETKDRQEETTEPQAGQATAAEPQNTDTATPGPVPYERFKEVTDALRELKAWKAQQEQAAAAAKTEADKAKQKQLREQEKWQELATAHEQKVAELEPQLQAATAERDRAYEVLEAHAESLLDSVPALFRPLVESLPVLERLAWLTENRDKLTLNGGRAAGTPQTPNGTGRGVMTDEERRQKARQFNF
jgi:hypothetical protein